MSERRGFWCVTLSCAGTLIAAGCGGTVETESHESVGEAPAALTTKDGAFLANGAYPAILRIPGSPSSCGGALIASNVVLTAAHCVDQVGDGFPESFATAAAGPYEIDFADPLVADEAQPAYAFPPVAGEPSVDRVIFAPNYPEDRAASDAALIVLRTPVSRRRVIPARVASSADIVPKPGFPPSLQFIDAHVFASENCAALGSLYYVPATVLVSFSPVMWLGEGERFCPGDSGTPWFTASLPGPTASLGGGKIFSLTSLQSGDDLEGPRLYLELRPWLREKALDADEDGIEAFEDNCDRDYNPDQEDRDDDGVGDACDPCPTLAGEWFDGDEDGDGLPRCADPCPDDGPSTATFCSADGLAAAPGGYGDADGDGACDSRDNCPLVANQDQRNSNRLSEDKWIAPGFEGRNMGDACEPVPVPRGEAGDPEVVDSFSVNSPFLRQETLRVVTDEVLVQRLRSRVASDRQQEDEELCLEGLTPPARITARFCQEDPALPPCTSEPLVDDVQLRLDEPELPQHRWHRVTVSSASGRGGFSSATQFDGGENAYRWDYEEDSEYWMAREFPVIPPAEVGFPVSGGAHSGLRGHFWWHAETSWGTRGSGSAGTVGTHGPVDLQGDELLANAYFEIDPERVIQRRVSFPLQSAFPLFLWRTLPDPPPWLAGVSDYRSGDDVLLMPAAPGELGALLPDGSAVLVTERLSAGLRTRLLDPSLTWVNQAEPSDQIGSAQAPLALALDATGRQVLDGVLANEDGASLASLADGVIGAATAQASEATLAPRAGFTTTYSRVLGRVFVLGGVDPDAREARFLLHGSADVGGLFPFGLSEPLGAVQAATVSHRPLALFAVDHVDREVHLGQASRGTRVERRARLLRIDPVSGRVDVVFEVPRLPGQRRTDLVVDDRGRILVASSPENGNRHVVLRFDPMTNALSVVRRASGRLTFAPIVDPNGITYVTERPSGGLGVERVRHVDAEPCAWQTLGEVLE